MDKNKDYIEYRKFPLFFRFYKDEMKIVAKMNLRLLLPLLSGVDGLLLLAGILHWYFTGSWLWLMIAGIGILLTLLTAFEWFEQLEIDEVGVRSKGVIWPRPVNLIWEQITDIKYRDDLIKRIEFRYEKNGKEKIGVLMTFKTQEIVKVLIEHYENYEQTQLAKQILDNPSIVLSLKIKE
jgi:hypothetical protein